MVSCHHKDRDKEFYLSHDECSRQSKVNHDVARFITVSDTRFMERIPFYLSVYFLIVCRFVLLFFWLVMFVL